MRLNAPIKIGGKRMPLAATGIDFNRILLSAYLPMMQKST
jgi:hypothetical protein